MEDKIKELLLDQLSKVKEIEDLYEEGFDPCDTSGGNFDDAYELGREHGIEEGKLIILRQLLKTV